VGVPIRVLIVEDSQDDATLLIYQLKRAGYDPEFEVVDTAPGVRRALEERTWDVIISDFNLPSLDAFGVLAIFKGTGIDIPFIIVSGTIDQDSAVSAMKSGAHDYLLKDNLGRLVPAIQRELVEADVRASRRYLQHTSAFLLRAGGALASSLDFETTLSTAARLAVSELGDCCVIDLLNTDGCTERAMIANNDGQGDATTEFETEFSDDDRFTNIRQGVLQTGRAELVSDDGGVQCIIAPLIARGRAFGTMGVISRLSSRKYIPNDLALTEDFAHRAAVSIDNARLYKEAQDANRLKDEFVAMISHELRTPLTPIMGAVHMLRMEDQLDGAAIERSLDMIERNVRTQAQIIDDLLDISRIVTGKLRLKLGEIDVQSVVAAAIEAVRPATEAKNIQLRLSLTSDPGCVLGDPDRLQQIVWNLLSNAAKFTPPGGKITLSLGATVYGVEIRVTDSGIGIAPEFLPFVFDRFRQADSSSTRVHGGLGLGLAIVRQLVELHGGSVHAESAGTGRGSSFVVRLPSRATFQVAERKIG
jgi:signal transduction histidine kinase/DNA-binding NarL/FixJ family response regulator